jgi:hypothetical protein
MIGSKFSLVPPFFIACVMQMCIATGVAADLCESFAFLDNVI